MTVFGAGDIEAAASAGTLRVGPRDLVTPLARERAKDLGVKITICPALPTPPDTPERTLPAPPSPHPPPVSAERIPASPPAPPTPVVEPGAGEPPADRSGSSVLGLRPPSGALFRRGAPLPPDLAFSSAASITGASGVTGGRGVAGGRVVVIGAGNVGTVTALRLADADRFAEIVLVDIDSGRAAGVALDLTHSAALGGFATRVRGTGTVEDAGRADYVVITAGRARQPGMSRADLTNANAAVVGDLAQRVAGTSPDAVILVVTNPLDEMTQHAWRSSGFPPERVIGMAGVLDTARFRALAALAAGERADRVEAVALGSHGEEMVIPLSQARAGGRPLTSVIARSDLEAITDRTRGSGGEVVGLLKSGSAFLAPGLSAARMVLAMAAGTGEVMTAAVLADGSYGIRDVYVGLPVRLAPGGLKEIVELDLRPGELAALREAADRIRDRLGQLAAPSLGQPR